MRRGRDDLWLKSFIPLISPASNTTRFEQNNTNNNRKSIVIFSLFAPPAVYVLQNKLEFLRWSQYPNKVWKGNCCCCYSWHIGVVPLKVTWQVEMQVQKNCTKICRYSARWTLLYLQSKMFQVILERSGNWKIQLRSNDLFMYTYAYYLDFR